MSRYQEHIGIAAIDDISAHVIAIRGAVSILAARYRLEFTRADVAELRRILTAAAAIQTEHLTVRREMSADYQRRRNAS